ncbi:MAG: ABC transporter permease [Tannerella sp.]|jgi:ABC-2 type transport system permease protein|nr:ABC transporter permease [Tannerella sp.]
MRKLILIIEREYMWRISRKSFLLLTFLLPFLFVALMSVPFWLSSIGSGAIHNIVIIDETGKYAPLFEDTDSYRFLYGDKSLEAYRASDDREISAFLSITADLLQDPAAAILYSEKQIPGDLSALVNRVLTKQLEQDKLASFRIPDLEQIIAESRVSFKVQTFKWGKDGNASSSSTPIAQMIGIFSTLIVYMFIMMYGGMVMQGVIEEKTSRIVEIMVSSVRPFDLMTGKIVGIGLVGLTQIILWGILVGVLLVVAGLFMPGFQADTAMMSTGSMIAASDPPAPEWLVVLQSFNFMEITGYFIFYFLGGYLLYASVFAAIGSAVNSPEDTQQFMTPIMIILIFALYVGIYSSENPDGSVAFWCSLIPFTSPVVMMMRIPFEVALWQKLLSVALLFAAAVGLTYFAAKIYRVGILMYGKKIHLKEILRWITFR